VAITQTNPIFYGRRYPEGPRMTTAQTLFPNVTGTAATQPVQNVQAFDMTASGMSCVQSVEIDNSQNSQELTAQVFDTGQIIYVPAFTIATSPLYTSLMAPIMQFSSIFIGAPPVCTIKFFNVPQNLYLRSIFGSEAQGSANVGGSAASPTPVYAADTNWAINVVSPGSIAQPAILGPNYGANQGYIVTQFIITAQQAQINAGIASYFVVKLGYGPNLSWNTNNLNFGLWAYPMPSNTITVNGIVATVSNVNLEVPPGFALSLSAYGATTLNNLAGSVSEGLNLGLVGVNAYGVILPVGET
jgi:hypothetical protein